MIEAAVFISLFFLFAIIMLILAVIKQEAEPRYLSGQCRHDWDMEFPEDTSLSWYFKCNKCGRTRPDMPTPQELSR